MLKLKVCGLTDPSNIQKIIELGPEMIGLIFHSSSPRDVRQKNAIEFCAIIPPHIKRVGVFVDSDLNFIEETIARYKLDIIQLYHEDISTFQDLRKKVKIIKAISVNTKVDLIKTNNYADQADIFLFDTKGEKPGGNGIKFDWRILQNYKDKVPFILSGGIGPDDAEAIKQVHHKQFYGIDINSKFEYKPGIKNINAIHNFKTQLYENDEYTK